MTFFHAHHFPDRGKDRLRKLQVLLRGRRAGSNRARRRVYRRSNVGHGANHGVSFSNAITNVSALHASNDGDEELLRVYDLLNAVQDLVEGHGLDRQDHQVGPGDCGPRLFFRRNAELLVERVELARMDVNDGDVLRRRQAGLENPAEEGLPHVAAPNQHHFLVQHSQGSMTLDEDRIPGFRL